MIELIVIGIVSFAAGILFSRQLFKTTVPKALAVPFQTKSHLYYRVITRNEEPIGVQFDHVIGDEILE